MHIEELLDEALATGDEKRATSVIEQARGRVSDQAKVGAFSLEVVVPNRPDELWLRERVLRPLIFVCQLTGAPPPICAGVFLTFFRRERVYCVLGAQVIAWACELLKVGAHTLTDRYDTGEQSHAAPLAH